MENEKTKHINDMRTEFQRKAFRLAHNAGKARHFAELNGGTGDLRRELSAKEVAKKRSRRKMAKASRKGNR